jgi:hypothetical protein
MPLEFIAGPYVECKKVPGLKDPESVREVFYEKLFQESLILPRSDNKSLFPPDIDPWFSCYSILDRTARRLSNQPDGLFVDVMGVDFAAELKEFELVHEEAIKVLKSRYGAENVRIRWGFCYFVE